MKILLVSSNIADTPYAVYPFGMSIVASALSSAGYCVKQTDFLQSKKSLDVLSKELNAMQPNIVGVSMRNIDNVNSVNEQRYIDSVVDIVLTVKKNSSAIVVLGGSGFSLMPDEILEKTGADYGITGEGEKLMVEFVKNAEKGIFPGAKILRSKNTIAGCNISSALHDLKLMKYYLRRINVASVQTKRGCPYKCIYCSYPLLEGDRVRVRSPKIVIEDIKKLTRKYGIKLIFFVDSVFNDSEGRYLELMEQMKYHKVNVSWTALFTPRGLTDKNVKLMKDTGLRFAELGSDAPTDFTLKRLGKSFLFQDIINANDLLVRHKVTPLHCYMFGCPGETKETVIEGIKNIKKLKSSVSVIYMGIRIFPNTKLAKVAENDGIIKKECNLLDSAYYISPLVDKKWLKKILIKSFKGVKNCIFPPDALSNYRIYKK